MIANEPTLNGGVIFMAKRTRQRPDAPTRGDPLDVIGHTQTVRVKRTNVNLDNVNFFADLFRVNDGRTTGAVLRALWLRTGLSMAAAAKACGYAGASSVQRYFNEEFDQPLDPDVASKIAKGLAGKGRPPVQAEDVLRLSAYVPAESQGPGLSERGAASLVQNVLRRFGVETEPDDPELLRTARLLIALLKLTASRQELDDLALIQGLFAGAEIQPRNG